MSGFVTVGDHVMFSANNGVIVSDAVGALDNPERLVECIRRAAEHLTDPELVEQGCGPGHPMFDDAPWLLSLDDYVTRRNRWREAAAAAATTSAAKRSALACRRAQFDAARPDLVLALIDRGDPYVCAQEGCDVDDALTIDHVVPVVRGGRDEVENLRFMCRSHNSAKGAR